MPELAPFQKAFAAAVLTDDQPGHPFRSLAFAVYRNTAARGAVEALRASFSTVDALLGSDMFSEVALDFRRETPPAGPVLSEYGAGFPGWLARQPWTSELPYLADVARLDWLWLECFLAGDSGSEAASPRSKSRVMLHPAARFVRLATPALTIWQAHRELDGFDELEPDWREEIALFTRPGLDVRVRAIDPACHSLLMACIAPTPVVECVTAVAEAHPQSNVPELLQQCVAAGALIIR